ncbi:eotaxin-like [Enoplosus armatus]|uniref:eotaxin-like n=1 Tax=Enoplosus armatus TaxID=215367 RepID=UPI0039934739
MSPRGDAKLFFCILFIACCCTVTLAQIPMDCCLNVKNKTIAKSAFGDYRQQIKGQGCSLSAMILVTRRGDKKLCVPDNEPWVQEVVKHVDFLKKYCKKHNYKGNRCLGVKQE